MSTELEKTLEELGRDLLATFTKVGLGLYAAWTEREEGAENPSTGTPPPPPNPTPAPTGRQAANDGTYLPRHFRTSNDQGVRRVWGAAPGKIGECGDDGVVFIERGLQGSHSLTHALRHAAHIVKAADCSDGHEDFLRVLDAIEGSEL